MRLLHVDDLKLHEFKEGEAPKYAILSHTWGKDEFLFEEVKFLFGEAEEVRRNRRTATRGIAKILNACEQAKRDGLDYVWIDTCCIDKSSSSEESLSINSMYKWYKHSSACYIFLEDVTMERDGYMKNFKTSYWFTRGWTLQELIAPHGAFFFDSRWKPIASRYTLAKQISEATGIKETLLRREHAEKMGRDEDITDAHCKECLTVDPLESILIREPIAEKLKWAAERSTKISEDAAYCLMGLFDVNMPVLYGEGKKAFHRLQEEVLRVHPDQSVLTWIERHPDAAGSCLARSPSVFKVDLYENYPIPNTHGAIVQQPRGLEVDVLLAKCTVTTNNNDTSWDWPGNTHLAVLNCVISSDRLSRVAIVVQPIDTRSGKGNSYWRDITGMLVVLEPDMPPRVIRLREQSDQSHVSVDCSLEAFKARRILLEKRPTKEVSNHSGRAVKVKVQGSRNWSVEAEYPSFNKEGVLEIDKDFKFLRDRHGTQLGILGVFFLTNHRSCFIVILAFDASRDTGHAKGESPYFSWVESCDTFIGRKFARMRLEDVTDETLEEAQELYLESFRSRTFERPGSRLYGIDYQAETRVETTEFLDRQVETLVVDIDHHLQTRELVRPVSTRGERVRSRSRGSAG